MSDPTFSWIKDIHDRFLNYFPTPNEIINSKELLKTHFNHSIVFMHMSLALSVLNNNLQRSKMLLFDIYLKCRYLRPFNIRISTDLRSGFSQCVQECDIFNGAIDNGKIDESQSSSSLYTSFYSFLCIVGVFHLASFACSYKMKINMIKDRMLYKKR